MREIEFRGKTVYEMPKPFSEWIHGYLCFVYTDNPFKARIYNTSTAKSYDVLTETVGQFTGQLDINGTKIFEGDICIWGGENSVVSFSEGCFWITDSSLSQTMNEFEPYQIEVIGNIHDNPELLEVSS